MLMMKLSFWLLLLYIFASSALAQIDSEIFLDGATVTGIAQDDENLWVATYGQGIYKYSTTEQKWENFSTKSNNLDDDLFYTIEVNKDYVWAGSVGGLFTLTKKTNKWSKRKFAQGGQFGNWIRSLKYDPSQDVLWIGRFRNLTRLDVEKRRYTDIDMTQSKDQKSNNIKTIAIDGDSLIWFGTESGVHRYEKKKMFKSEAAWKYISNKKRGFNEEGENVSVSSIIFENNKIWYGTDEFTSSSEPGFNVGGIYIYDRRLDWKKISQLNGLADNGIYALCRTGNFIWAGIYSFDRKENIEQGKGLFLINRNTLQVTEIDLDQLKIRSSTFLTFYFDGENMWIGSNSGLLRIRINNPLARLDEANVREHG
jgi:ligand-binding sensor domain-containing protein